MHPEVRSVYCNMVKSEKTGADIFDTAVIQCLGGASRLHSSLHRGTVMVQVVISILTLNVDVGILTSICIPSSISTSIDVRTSISFCMNITGIQGCPRMSRHSRTEAVSPLFSL